MSDLQESPVQEPALPTQERNQEETGGDRGSMTMPTVYVCAAIGGMIAAIADIVQKEQASAVMKMTAVSARHLNLAVPPLYVFAIVVFLGVLLCFVFQPNNRRAGFAVGAGVIASIMTVTPYQPLQTGQPTAPETDTFLQPGQLRGIQLATSDISLLRLAMNLTDLAVISVTNDLAVPVEVKVSFYDRNSRQPYEQTQAIAAGRTRQFEFSAAASHGAVSGEFYIEVGGERSGYVPVSGAAPYHSEALSLTQAVPSFAKAQINTHALHSYSSSASEASRPASDTEVREIYNKPTGFIDRLQQKLLTPKKW